MITKAQAKVRNELILFRLKEGKYTSQEITRYLQKWGDPNSQDSPVKRALQTLARKGLCEVGDGTRNLKSMDGKRRKRAVNVYWVP